MSSPGDRLTRDDIEPGAIVSAAESVEGIKAGTLGVIDAVYGNPKTGLSVLFCVAWNTPENPLPKGYRAFGDCQRLGVSTRPTRTAIAGPEELGILRLYRKAKP